MGKGLLAWWRRRIVARGLAGAALFAVPVVVAALIGFGTGFSGVAGGLSSVTSGPDPVPAASQTGPTKLTRGVVGLASKQAGTSGPASPDNGTGGSSGNSSDINSDDSSGSTGSGSSSGGGSTGTQIPTINAPSAPTVNVPNPGGGATSGTTDAVNNTVNGLLGGVNQTVNGLPGGGK
jgi:type IV secretion system protein TrbL